MTAGDISKVRYSRGSGWQENQLHYLTVYIRVRVSVNNRLGFGSVARVRVRVRIRVRSLHDLTVYILINLLQVIAPCLQSRVEHLQLIMLGLG